MADDRLIAGIELGGTKGIALIARGREILAQARVPTTTPAETLGALRDHLAGWQAEHGRPEALGINSFGPLGLDRARADYGHITSTPKPGWKGTDVIGHFAAAYDGPIGFEVDVGGAAMAEHRWGAAQGAEVAVYITIGTGLGGGVIVDGRPTHGLIHPEIGHVRIRRAHDLGFAGVCPFHGDCIEGLVSGPAIAARTGQKGDAIPADHPVWTGVAEEVAELAAMLLFTISPQRILIGGGVFQNRTELLPAVRAGAAAKLAGYLSGIGEAELATIIDAPGLGDLAGPLGAIAVGLAALS